MRFERLKWPDVKELDFSSLVVLVPLGSLEQHGHHLPLNTDSAIVTALAEQLETLMPDKVLLLPTVWAGHSTHHLAFPGTVSLYQEHYKNAIIDVCTSLIKSGATRIFLFNGHGGNDLPVRYALREVKTQNPDRKDLHVVFASYWSIAADTLRSIRESGPGGMGHACEMETSLMLHLHPELVDMDKARRDMLHGAPVYEVLDFHEISKTGTVGHPDLASAEKGARFFDGIIADCAAFLRALLTW
jgi:creatinine amidohydrolase